MKLKEIISCYATKVYECEKSTFDKSVSAFNNHGNPFECNWTKSTDLTNKVVFKKGASICPTFNYSGAILEVKAIFKFDSSRDQMSISIGNTGFPFEPLLSKNRYHLLSENIHEYLTEAVNLKEKTA